ncbi:hypothetical protein Pelo_8060 [Pelomyxa schiedti]|nr:hypothetical protein Pelo_8060 [Pelomyxa schiedti]
MVVATLWGVASGHEVTLLSLTIPQQGPCNEACLPRSAAHVCGPCAAPECRGCQWCPECRRRGLDFFLDVEVECTNFPNVIAEPYNHTKFCAPCEASDFEGCEQCVLCVEDKKESGRDAAPTTKLAFLLISLICSLGILLMWAYLLKPHVPHGYKSLP